jgi:hypothetical protein
MRWRPNTPEKMEAELRQYGVDYLLINNWLSQPDVNLLQYLETHKVQLDTVWHNERNCLLHIEAVKK